VIQLDDSYHDITYLKEFDVSVETFYKLDFDGDRTCGFSRIYKGKMSEDPLDENYEIYQELYECGLKKEEVENRRDKLISEIKDKKIDVDF
jgi:hypothetical protein